MSHPLNFSPKPFRGHNYWLYAIMSMNVMILALSLWTAWNGAQLRAENKQSHQQLAELQNEKAVVIASLNQALGDLGQVDIKNYDRQMEQYDSIHKAFNTEWVQLLNDLANLVNPDVRIIRVQTSDSSQLSLRGSARTKEAQLSFIRALQSHSSFSRIRFDSETYAARNITFELQFAYRGGS